MLEIKKMLGSEVGKILIDMKDFDYSYCRYPKNLDYFFSDKIKDPSERDHFFVAMDNNLPVGILKYQTLPFEKKIFGIDSARLDFLLWKPDLKNSHNIIDKLVKEALFLAEEQKIRFLAMRAEDNKKELIEILKANLFEEITIYKTFYMNLKKIKSQETKNIRFVKEEDIPKIKEIAGNAAFIHSRFYKDTHFDKNDCATFYATWIANSVKNPRHSVLVYDDNGILGFIDLSHSTLPGKKITDLDLIAVDKNSRGKGVGKNLVNSAIIYLKNQKINNFYVETEKDNQESTLLYAKMGGKDILSIKIMHKWLK